MIEFVRSEWLKQKHSFNKVLVWLSPILTILLALVLMRGSNMQNGAYNWWYIMLLPGSFTMFSGFTIARERKNNRHGLLGVVVDQSQLWIAQIVINTGFLFLTCMVFFIGITLGGVLIESTIVVTSSFLASTLLFVTFAWQVPFWMYITEKIGVFPSIFLSIIGNSPVAAICAANHYWWIPFSIPARLMSPIIKVLPNGLPVEEGSKMADSRVILPGVLITLTLYGVLTLTTSLWYRKREVSS